MLETRRLAICDPNTATREPLRNLLLGVESIYLEAESNRYEFFRDVIEQYRPDLAIITLDSDASPSAQLASGSRSRRPRRSSAAGQVGFGLNRLGRARQGAAGMAGMERQGSEPPGIEGRGKAGLARRVTAGCCMARRGEAGEARIGAATQGWAGATSQGLNRSGMDWQGRRGHRGWATPGWDGIGLAG